MEPATRNAIVRCTGYGRAYGEGSQNGRGTRVAQRRERLSSFAACALRGLREERSLAAVDSHDGAATEDPGWVGAGWEDLEAAAVLAFEVAERAG